VGTLHLLPWCRLKTEQGAGPVKLIPFWAFRPPEYFSTADNQAIEVARQLFHGLSGKPIIDFCLAQFQGKELFADLASDEGSSLLQSVDLLCFSALAWRDFFSFTGPYCNTDCFVVYRPSVEGKTAIYTSHRRDGSESAMGGIAAVFHAPVHAGLITSIELDAGLLAALCELQDRWSRSDSGKWRRWHEAIVCFNRANTDDEGASPQTDWMLMAGAFQRFLGTGSSAPTKKFRSILVSSKASLDQKDMDVIGEWMDEFYNLRNDFAHGRLRSQKTRMWAFTHHLAAAAVAFPVLVRCALQSEGFVTGAASYVVAFAKFLLQIRDLSQKGKPDIKGWYQLLSEGRLQEAISSGLKSI